MIVFIIATNSTYAALSKHGQETVKNATILVTEGAYQSAYDALDKLFKADKNTPEATYWMGFCKYKLQDYKSAEPLLNLAIELDTKKEFSDTAYMLGQSQYAQLKYSDAEKSFNKSITNKYKPGSSLYYIGYIQNLTNRDNEALKTFARVLEQPSSEDEMKQPAQFQIGEINFEQTQKKYPASDKSKQADAERRKLFIDKTKPAYEKTIDLNPESALANQSKGRIAEINARLGIEAPKTAGGTPIPQNSSVIRISQDIKYDSNIINEADNKVLKVTDAGAFSEKTSIFAKYEYIKNNWWAITPELSTDFTYNLRRGNLAVIANDALNINPSLRNRMDHKVKDKPASGLVEYEYAYMAKDFKSKRELPYYTKSQNIIIGERVNLFFSGSTTFKINTKFSENQNRFLNYIAPAISLSQGFMTFNKYLLNVTFTWEQQRAKDPFNDQRSYKTNFSYSIPKLIWEINVDPAFSYTVTDTINQRDARGFEKNINPSVGLSRAIDKKGKFNANFNFGWTRNLSVDRANYAYQKYTYSLGATYTF